MASSAEPDTVADGAASVSTRPFSGDTSKATKDSMVPNRRVEIKDLKRKYSLEVRSLLAQFLKGMSTQKPWFFTIKEALKTGGEEDKLEKIEGTSFASLTGYDDEIMLVILAIGDLADQKGRNIDVKPTKWESFFFEHGLNNEVLPRKFARDTQGKTVHFLRVGGDFGSLNIKSQFDKDLENRPKKPSYRISRLRNDFVDGINDILLDILSDFYIKDCRSIETAASEESEPEEDAGIVDDERDIAAVVGEELPDNHEPPTVPGVDQEARWVKKGGLLS